MCQFVNYQFSLTAAQSQELQVLLRLLPASLRSLPIWDALHEITYSEDWTDQPKFKLASGQDDK